MGYFHDAVSRPRAKKKAAKKKAAKKKAAKKKAGGKSPLLRKVTPYRRRKAVSTRRGELREKLLKPVAFNWAAIRKAAGASLGFKGKSLERFLPEDISEATILGCGFWGCAFKTGDPRFVVKVSIDLTEGPHVSLAKKLFGKDPGLAYFHRIWQLPNREFTNEFGWSPVWVMVREEVNFTKQFANLKFNSPAKGYEKVWEALSYLPACCACLNFSELDLSRGACSKQEVAEATRELKKLMSLARTPGEYVGKLIVKSYEKYGVLLGDVHYGNVGSRIHDLSEFGIKNHRKLVVTDLGSWHQAPVTADQYDYVEIVPGAKFR